MPPKRASIGRYTSNTRSQKRLRTSQSSHDKQGNKETDRLRALQSHSAESDEQRTAVRNSRSRASETGEKQTVRVGEERLRASRTRRTVHADLNRGAFNYNVNYDYSRHPSVDIGKMDKVCGHCDARTFRNETPGMCCANGKVKLPILNPPPEPLLSLLSGNSSESKHFLQNIRKYNSAFQMTSFGAHKVVQDQYMLTFKIQGQIYHRLGSLLPVPDDEHKFLQIYFMGDDDVQVDQRCSISPGTKHQIISSLQSFLHQHNSLIKLFKTSIENLPADNYAIHIRADKTPVGQHAGRYNAPTTNEVAIVIIGEQSEARDIILQRRNNTIVRVPETHRSYDALQYPIIFWEGEDGYHFNIMQINPTTSNIIYSYITHYKKIVSLL